MKTELKNKVGFKEINLNVSLLITIIDVIKRYDGELTFSKLSKKLEKKVNKNILRNYVDYLYHTQKISVDKLKKIGWIFYPNSNLKKSEKLEI